MPATVTAITDTFEVATDVAFTATVASLSVPQTAGTQTSVTLGVLGGSATYYWRVRAVATDAIGATSATTSFRIGRAIVSGPYQLTIELPASCPNSYVNELLAAGDLTVADRTWHFRATDNNSYMGMLQLILDPVRTKLSGTVQGKFKWVDNAPFYLSIGLLSETADPPPTVPVSGSVSPDALIDGTLSSTTTLLHRTFSVRLNCTSTFNWTLAPR